MNEEDQRTWYNSHNDNKYYTRCDRKNGPDYQDERRDGTSRTTDWVRPSNTVMYSTERRPTRAREQEEILIMQELQPLPSSPKKN